MLHVAATATMNLYIFLKPPDNRQARMPPASDKKFFDRFNSTIHQWYRPALRSGQFELERHAQRLVNRRGDLGRSRGPVFGCGPDIVGSAHHLAAFNSS